MSINGLGCGFDKCTIGLNGFENPFRDREVELCKFHVGSGCKLKLSDNGDILIKRVGSGRVFVQNTLSESAVSNAILKLPFGLLEHGKSFKLFDIKKFKENLILECEQNQPNWCKLEDQVNMLCQDRLKYLLSIFSGH